LDCSSGNIDLHIHSTASDGSLNPIDILALAETAGLAAMALTDHDAIEGTREIIDHGIPDAIQFMTGVEISAAPLKQLDIYGSFHILGYGFRLDDPALNRALITQQAARKNRNPRLIARLNEMGFDISLEEVVSASGRAQIGRPHIAALMVKKGYAASIEEVFDAYIGKGKPGYVEKQRIAPEKAMALIRGAGGIPVLAHPGLLEIKTEKAFDRLITALTAMGLKGLEAFYSGHTQKQTAFFEDLAGRHNLLVTGGSDFHGAINPEVRLGKGRGDLCVPYTVYERLMHEVQRLQHA
jgi:3',5'-nucleoside bisphosphate phosphatase